MALRNIVKLDGRTGEGGGQLFSHANQRLGGLKAQHLSCIQCLAEATSARLTDCYVGSKAIVFEPQSSPAQLVNRNIRVKADSAASVLLVFQALLPFLVFAADENNSPVTATIQGGTNVSFSPSFEYIDQVLLPSLERFGIKVDRKLEFRGWSHGTRQIGSAKFIVFPVALGSPLIAPQWPTERGTITKIDISVIVPRDMREDLKKALIFELGLVFPDTETNFVLVDDSRHNARMYTLLVAHTTTSLRFGRDWLYDRSSKHKTWEDLSTEISQKVVDDLDNEIRKGGLVDEHLQDQLIVFQALSEGRTIIPGSVETATSDRERVEKAEEPFGDGSTHTTTARWVTSQLLPELQWIDRGRVCEGVAWKASLPMTE
ncbi:RNA 3'-terminal phosphate cyclase-domain-containing protein [Halenospora varia]|nr:RNA 3'-terminal phosphate cyclase-domain-containing protein [Halenospora varia]